MPSFTEIASDLFLRTDSCNVFHRTALHTPSGLTCEPTLLEGSRSGDGVTVHRVKLLAAPGARSGLHLGEPLIEESGGASPSPY